MKNLALSTIFLLFSVSVVSASAAGNAAAGKAKAAMCQGCHGVDGNSVNPMWPKLAGQNAGYIAKQLTDFKSGRRKDPSMSAMAAGLSDVDMANLGAYYASLKPGSNVAHDAAVAKRGERLYRGGNAKTGVSACMSCHGPSGKGIPPKFPRVSGQHAAYAEKQLLAFKSEKRANDDQIMTRIAFRMSEEEIKAVSEYMAGLR